GVVLLDLDVSAVGAAALLDGAHDDGLDDLTALDVATGDGLLDGGHDDVADAGIAPRRATEHADAQDLLGARVVGDLHPRFLLNHSISSTWLRMHGRYRPDVRGIASPKSTQGLPERLAEVCPRQPVNSRRRPARLQIAAGQLSLRTANWGHLTPRRCVFARRHTADLRHSVHVPYCVWAHALAPEAGTAADQRQRGVGRET